MDAAVARADEAADGPRGYREGDRWSGEAEGHRRTGALKVFTVLSETYK